MKKLLVILGPTASGKTDLALKLAKKLNGELVACDSRQVYKGLDIGTGKIPGDDVPVVRGNNYWGIEGINVWMYDVVDVEVRYSVADYMKDTSQIVDDISGRGKLPIIVGGTGFYLKALLQGLSNLSIPVNEKLRQDLENLSLEDLQRKLQPLSIHQWNEMNRSDKLNKRRLVRAIELLSTNRREPSFKGLAATYDVLKIGLTAPREKLYERVDNRVRDRIGHGMIEEARKLHKMGLTLDRMRELGLEYGVLADYLEGNITSINDLTVIMQNRIHGYVRRQETWFKKEKDIDWFAITDEQAYNKIEKLVIKWYDNNINVEEN